MTTTKIKRSDDSSLCITRKKRGRGFYYVDEKGEKITAKNLIKRLKGLIIPPMWTDVKICKWDDGHIQAIGRDAKGRKQYIYHSEWERKRQEEKFKKMFKFGKALPSIRKKAIKDLNRKNWRKSKVIALMVMILDETGIRIGNKQYAKRNETYGLSTLRRKHMDVDDEILKFEFKGKSNKLREVEIDDADLIKMIRISAELPGYELFRYKTGYNSYENVDSNEVNEYIRKNMGKEFSSKDFRTWVATRYAVELYPEAIKEKEDAPRKKFGNILIRLVADELGNTPTVCRSYYVHPKIMSKIESQTLFEVDNFRKARSNYGLSKEEKIILNII